jgi:predicted permease
VVGIVPSDADLGIQQVHDRADYAPAYSGGHVAVWEAFQPTAAAFPRQTHPFLTIGRLAPNASVASAQQELAAIAGQLEHAYPENLHRGVNVERYSDVVFAPVRTVLYVLLAAVTLVLLVTCANVANLLLARTTTRAREVAVRLALGASGGRIRRQFLAESAVLVLLGALAGVGTAVLGLRALIALAPADVPRLGDARIDGGVLLYTLGISAAVAVLFGLLPTLQSRRLDIQETLKTQPGRRVSESRGARRFRAALVVGEVALAVALVAGAGLLLRTVWQLENVNTGFETANIVEAQYQLPATRFPIDFKRWPNIPEITQFHARYLADVRAIPGVQSAGIAGGPPIDPGFTNSFTIVGREAESAAFPEIRTRFLTPGYLTTLGVPLLAGRDIGPGDDASAPQVVVINHAAAERYFAGRNPLGQELRFWGTTRRIVGVIGDERFEGLEAPAEPAVYGPMAQNPQQEATLLVRVAGGDPMAIAPALRRALHAVDPQLALYGVTPLQAAVSRTISGPRFSAALLAVFGATAILLALVGVHGMLSYTVAQRRPEMGIRMALGASGWNVMRLVVSEGMALALLGVVVGLALALAASRAMTSLVFGITATDPATFATVALAVLVTSAVASVVPALRAVRVDTMEALRAD